MKLECYHCQDLREVPLTFPIYAEGPKQWLGDGYYFWQDVEFAEKWGFNNKCQYDKELKQFCIHHCVIECDEDDFLDTVFNEEHYYDFVKSVEYFAEVVFQNIDKKPTLEDFNIFLTDHNIDIWNKIKVIRFQDLPKNNSNLAVLGYYYKKRIQIRVNEPDVIKSFGVYNIYNCR